MLTTLCSALILGPTMNQTPNKENFAHDLDFWLGKWTADSYRPQPDGTTQEQKAAATNTISRTLNNKIIHEEFKLGNFIGESWSAFDPNQKDRTKAWTQTWVDNSGAYLTLQGGKVGNDFILTQLHPNPNQRMRFINIQKTSFTWLWEQKDKEGNWQLSWKLTYKIVKK